MGKSVVIVESPAKARTIGKFLGKGYQVASCMGHVRDLPKKTLGVDIEKDFEPQYEALESRRQVLAALRKAVKGAEAVYLAPDPDREGEAIAWHLCQSLRLPKSRVRRVTFNEITKRAVQKAFRQPREIDMNLVNAQQARRILDRIVGYQLSPLLWKKVARGLSAGRVQSVALRLIVEREKEVQAFQPEDYWKITAKLRPAEATAFEAELAAVDGQKAKVHNEQEATTLHERLAAEGSRFRVARVETKRQKSRPGSPFATSQRQQAASVRLGFRPRRTMRIAQQLYEGIEVGGEGSVGLITYMRTDSFRIASEALEACRAFIPRQFGEKYLSAEPRVFRSRRGAQEAHEAIRPTGVERTPEAMKSFLSADQLKLYRLIWERFVASQMAEAEYDVTRVQVEALGADGSAWALFRTSGRTVVFDGVTRVYAPLKRKDDREQRLPPLSDGLPLECLGIAPTQHFTKPPPRYTEASLVKTLEREGIGRPSTYAQIITTIQERGYTEVKDKAFYAKELGIVTNDTLLPFFENIINTKFTSELEQRLDDIEEGKGDWHQVRREFYEPFKADLARAKAEMRSVKEEIAEQTDEVCPKCGAAMLVRLSRGGRFLGCSAYPKCRYTHPVDEEGQPVETLDEKCPECGEALTVRTGRRGKFVGCSAYPKCRYTRNLEEKTPAEGEEPKPRPAPKDIGENCALCGQPLVERMGRRGRFIGCTGYPKCRFTRPIEGEEAAQPDEATDQTCEKCGKPMVAKWGRRGQFLACSGYPDCKNAKPLKGSSAPAAAPPKETGRECPECGKPLVVRTGRRGEFIGCSAYPKCRHTEDVAEGQADPGDTTPGPN